MSQEGTLFTVITAHCIFIGACGHTEVGVDPWDVHDRMEAHYRSRHQGEIDAIVYDLTY